MLACWGGYDLDADFAERYGEGAVDCLAVAMEATDAVTEGVEGDGGEAAQGVGDGCGRLVGGPDDEVGAGVLVDS